MSDPVPVPIASAADLLAVLLALPAPSRTDVMVGFRPVVAVRVQRKGGRRVYLELGDDPQAKEGGR